MLARYALCLAALLAAGTQIARGEESSTCTESTTPEAYFSVIEDGPETPVVSAGGHFIRFDALWPATAPTAVVPLVDPSAPGASASRALGEPTNPPQRPGMSPMHAPGSITPGPYYTGGLLTRSQSTIERPPVTSALELLERKRRQRDALDAEIRVLEEVTTPTPIIIYTQLMEISRSKLRAFEIDQAHFAETNGEASFKRIVGVQQLLEDGLGKGDWVDSNDGPFSAVLERDDPFFSVLKALQQNDVARVDADTLLTIFSGNTRSVHSGGKIPIPDPHGSGAIQFVEYGTHLHCKATMLSDGRISLEVDPEVTEIVEGDMLEVTGKAIPALKTRRFSLSGVVGAEQTLIIAGVVRERADSSEVLSPESKGGKRMKERIDEVELLVVLRCEPFDKGRTTSQRESI